MLGSGPPGYSNNIIVVESFIQRKKDAKVEKPVS